MRYTFLLLYMVVLQACAASSTCGDRGTQHEMTSCARDRLMTLELELDKKHQALSEVIEGNHLEQAILAWESYRDSHCASTSNIYEGGSLQGYAVAECQAELTRLRLNSLDDDYRDTLDIITQGSP